MAFIWRTEVRRFLLNVLIGLLHETPIPDLQSIVDGIRVGLESLKGEVSATRHVQRNDTAPSGYVKPKTSSMRDRLLIHIYDNPNDSIGPIVASIGGRSHQIRRIIQNLRNGNQVELGPRDGPYTLTQAGRYYTELFKKDQRVYIVRTASSDGLTASLEPSGQTVPSTPPLAETSVLPKAIQLYVPSIKRGRVESVRIVSDGIIKYDAGSLFGSLSKPNWEHNVTIDRRNRITLGLNSLLVQMDDGINILVDTGVGSTYQRELTEYGLVPSILLKNLKRLGLGRRDIHGVILTHLQFDHFGGCITQDRSGFMVPTFPRATHYVQSLSLEEAFNPARNSSKEMYHENYFHILEERGQLELLYGDTQILPGIEVQVTGGHKRGHQIVHVRYGGDLVVFLGDLIPTHYHLDPKIVSAYDDYPIETERVKQQILDQALKDGLLLVFSHGYRHHAGYLVEHKNEEGVPQRYFRPVNLT